jgi:C4-dicarboxylate-specific signal transduction histidine kinase
MPEIATTALASDDDQGSALGTPRRAAGNPPNLYPSADQFIECLTNEKELNFLGLIDVNDGLRTEEMLAKLRGEIAHAARISMLGELAASIAHEVSQPLTAIGSNTEAAQLWLDRSPPNLDEVRDLTARTAAEVQRAADIIRRIRAMVLCSAPEHVAMPVNPMIEEAILFLRHELQRNCVRVSLHLDEHLPEILGDRVQLQQVIANLVVNAIQAMNTVDITARQLLINSSMLTANWLHITVEDTGPGIAPELHDRVFERFFTTKSTGMGIGLLICRTIIEAHRGRIGVTNRRDSCGAHFSIVLPARRSPIS